MDEWLRGIIARLLGQDQPVPRTFQLEPMRAQGLDRPPDPTNLPVSYFLGPATYNESGAVNTVTDLGARVADKLRSQEAPLDTALNRRIYEAVEPFNYGKSPNELARLMKAVKGEPFESREFDKYNDPRREDAWLLYLGLPQKNNSLKPSSYRPNIAKDGKQKYYTPGILTLLENTAERTLWADASVPAIIKDKVEELDKRGGDFKGRVVEYDEGTNIMGNFTWMKGKDERGHYLSIYDRWDLDQIPVEGREGHYGRPFEIYDRIYYDPKTYQPK